MKQISVLSFILGLVLSMASCGGGGGPVSNAAPSLTVTSVTVSCNPTSVQTGQTSQCTATVTGTGSYSSTVTWSASGGTINSSGMFTAPATAGTVTVTATSTQDTGKSGSTTVSVTLPISLSISCPGSCAVPAGGSIQLTATVQNTNDVSVTWSTTAGQISGSGLYTAPALPPQGGSATVTATSQADPAVSASVNIAVQFSNASLSGNYVVELSLVGGGYAFAEELIADGNGNITGEEIPCPTGTQCKATYNVDSFGGGQISINGTPWLSFSLDGNGSGYVVQETASPVAGALVKQAGTIGPSISAFSGNWVFQFQGTDSAGNPAAAVGILSLSPSGSISGTEDFADGIGSGNNLSKVPFSGTATYSGGTSGAGTVAISSSQGTSYFAFYAISNTKMAIVSTDSASLAGWAEMQQGTFSTSSLTGNYVFLLSGSSPVSGDSMNPDTGYAHEVGEVVLDGKGNINGIFDLNESSFVITAESLSGSYNIASNGQGQAAVEDAYAPDTFDLYMISPNKAYLIDTGGENVMAGYLLMQQAGPFSNSSFAGRYAYLDFGAAQTIWYIDVGQMTASGGVISSWAEYNGDGGFSQGGTITQPIQTNGRGVVNLGTQVGNFAFYLISPSQAAMVGIDPDEAQFGELSKQF